METLIGRKEEQRILKKALQTPGAEMIAVIGRRRVGKTFLVETVYRERIVFQITGLQNEPKSKQLRNFQDQLSEYSESSLPVKIPSDWLEAFQMLRKYLKTKLGKEKAVIFLDELPWLATHKSGFLSAFGYFWNTWASKQNLIVVICGSAAAWMIKKVVNDKGGLHNRITRRIHLSPFTLKETSTFLQSRHIHFTEYQIVQIYMAMGGIPHYLKEIENDKSAVQNIDYICFSKNGLLRDEFGRLYPSLFAKAENHFLVVRALATKRQGLTRKEIVQLTKIPDGGGLTKVLEELTYSGFITLFPVFGKQKRGKLYRLTDEYSLFYLQFIEGQEHQGKTIWQHLSQTPAFKSWSGYAFESICLKHIEPIKEALKIAGIYAFASSYYQKGDNTQQGVQIDLVLDRNDHVINLFELKFYQEPFTITKSYAQQLRQKMAAFRYHTKTKKQLSWVFISTFGVQPNQHSLDLVTNDLSLTDLFYE
ncbi:MAG: ATP-binding protein [Bacteroidota bacterium]